MNWKKIIKIDEFRDSLMDCPKCEDGKLRIVKRESPRPRHPRHRNRGKLKCDRCGHEVVI